MVSLHLSLPVRKSRSAPGRAFLFRLAGSGAVVLAVLPPLVSAGPAHAASAKPRRQTFDARLYESYVRKHHRRLIPYKDHHGHITVFATAWMQHRKMCGGAISAPSMNPTTLSMLQEWQGCTAVEKIGTRTIKFNSDPWIS